MKKHLIALVAIVAVLLPLTAAADHLDGSFVSFGGGQIVISSGGHHHHHFRHHRRLRIVDHHGRPLDHHALRRGHPVTVHYSGHGEHRRAERIIVHERMDRGDHGERRREDHGRGH